METVEPSAPLRPLLVVGGNLALDFANTVDDPEGPARFDHLHDLPALLTWAQERALLTATEHATLVAEAVRDPAKEARQLRRAWELRNTVQSVFGAFAEGRPVDDTDWTHLSRAVAEALTHSKLALVDGQARISWTADRAEVVGWAVAYAAHELLTSSQLPRVKRCAGCPWLYLDQSKNSSRRWCTMEDCGKNAKMRRYVERRSARRASARSGSAD